MATLTFRVTLSGSGVGVVGGGGGDAVASVAAIDTAIDAVQAGAEATVAANVATLVADGASPTQAHVTTLNTNFALCVAAYAAVQTSQTAATGALVASGGLTIVIDTAVITNRTKLKAAIDAFLLTMSGNSVFA